MWIAVLPIPVVLIVCWAVIPSWEPRIRIAGMIMELFGLGTVAFGVRETRVRFKKSSLLETTRQWLKSFPKFKIETRIVLGTATLKLGGGTLSAFGTVSPSPTATLEERVALLERSLNQANEMIHQIQQKIEEETRKRDTALDAERRDREVGDEKNQQRLKEAVAEGLYIETTGVVWLFLGIILSTASNEITSCLFGIN